jgi:hypothetical protein
MTSCIESHLAFMPSLRIHVIAGKRLLIQMNACNVLLQGRVFSEGFFAWGVFSAAVFVSTVMRGNVTAKS